MEEVAMGLRVVEWTRRADVLGRPKLPCLAAYRTINLTAGCPNECRYCYAQSYGHHPGWGTVAFYSNALERLRNEWPTMRDKPAMVYFSTASEPFLPVERILDHMYGIMEFLLEAGVRLLISTKCVVPDRFVELFGRYRDSKASQSRWRAPSRVHVQVGLTTVDDSIRQIMEPRAAKVSERLDNLKRLIDASVMAEARMDPLIPELTDSDISFDAALYELSRVGVQQVAASFLFLRWGIRPPRNLAHGEWSFAQMRRLYTHRFSKYCGGGTIYLPSTDYRRERYGALRALADAHGIRVHECHCKNPDLVPSLSDDCCHPQPAPHGACVQPSLFDAQ